MTKNVLYWVYVLRSEVDKKMYIGYTMRINERLKEHASGKSVATAPRRPFKLIYLEACTNKKDAMRRENYFKKSGGRKFLALRLKEFFLDNSSL